MPLRCTLAMIADPSLGACRRNREGCIELGLWRPFYAGHVCEACLRADQADIRAGHLPRDEGWQAMAKGGAS